VVKCPAGNSERGRGNFPFVGRSALLSKLIMLFRRVVWLLLLAAWPLCAQVPQQTLELINGVTVSGRIVAFKDQHIQVALEGGGDTPVYTNVAWGRLSQKTLQQLMSNRQAAPFASIFLDPEVEPKTTGGSGRTRIVIPPRLDRPQGGSLFASPVMMVLLLLVYAANIYAGFEIGIFRQRSAIMVAAVSAFVPFIGPALFLALPTHRPKAYEAPVEEHVPVEAAPVVEEVAVVEEAPAAPTLPQPVVYPRGQFTFNRRFFETKFAGFLKMVPGEAEKDKIIHIKSARGEYTGQRLSKIEPNELFLQVRKGVATEDVMIPFSEIYEVTVKHKDT
jgi:hypothetical protein